MDGDAAATGAESLCVCSDHTNHMSACNGAIRQSYTHWQGPTNDGETQEVGRNLNGESKLNAAELVRTMSVCDAGVVGSRGTRMGFRDRVRARLRMRMRMRKKDR